LYKADRICKYRITSGCFKDNNKILKVYIKFRKKPTISKNIIVIACKRFEYIKLITSYTKIWENIEMRKLHESIYIYYNHALSVLKGGFLKSG